MSFLLKNGKYLLVGGKPLIVAAGGAAGGNMLSLTLTAYQVGNTLAHPVFQRRAGTENDANGGNADVPVLFSYTGEPSAVQARVVDADSHAIIKDWTTLTSPQFDDSNKTGLGTLPQVPIGMDYNTEIRVLNQQAMTSTKTQRWGVGICAVLTGQSNMLGTMYNNLSYNGPVPGTNPVVGELDYWLDPRFPGTYFGMDGFVVPGGWYNAPNTGSTYLCPGYTPSSEHTLQFMRIIGERMKAKYGRKIPICVGVWAFNGIGLEAITPPNPAGAQIYTNSGKTLTVFDSHGQEVTYGDIGWHSPNGAAPGDFEIVLLHQGEAASGSVDNNGNTNTGSGQARSVRVDSMDAFYTAMLNTVAPAGRTAANLAFLPAMLGAYTAFPYVEDIRGAFNDFINERAPSKGWTKVKGGWSCADIDAAFVGPDGTDGMHFRNIPGGTPFQQFRKMSMYRAIQGALHALLPNEATFGGMGPKVSGTTIIENGVKVITGATTRNGNSVTVAVTHDGGNTLAPRNSSASITGWYAHTRSDFDDTKGAAIVLPAGSVTVSGGLPVVAFPNGTQFPCYLKHLGGKPGTQQSCRPDVTNVLCDNVSYPTGAIGTDVLTGIPLQATPDPIKVT